MKFTLDDDAVLRLSSVSTALFAAHSYAAPADYQASVKFHYTVTAPKADISTRFFGIALGCVAASTMSAAVSDDGRSSKKNMLKTVGSCWAVAAAHHLYNAQQGNCKKDVAYACAAGQAAMSALMLWRGFSDD